MDFKKVLVIIPAYNEEGSVGKVVEEVKKFLPGVDILVVNDGSKDLTSEEAKASGAVVLDLPFNLGIGGAMQTGYKYAFIKGYDIAIQVDGDGQHDPKEISKLLNTLERNNADIVIGSRFLGVSDFKSSMMRRFGIFIFSKVISIILGQKITDPTSGFRAINKKVIHIFASNYPQDYPEPESLVLLHKFKCNVLEVPINMRQRNAGESSITKIKSIYYMVKVLLAIFVDCFKERSL
jgi:glycosyltransferase involved in cell wall biosynthesis